MVTPIEGWECAAREDIRELVARYTHFGDGGRLEELSELFAENATFRLAEFPPDVGRVEIVNRLGALRDRNDRDPHRSYVRHHVSNLQIEFASPSSATGRAYWMVLTDQGLARWGRYQDEYEQVDKTWRFSTRRVRPDGARAGSE
jgi:hypothetical protein